MKIDNCCIAWTQCQKISSLNLQCVQYLMSANDDQTFYFLEYWIFTLMAKLVPGEMTFQKRVCYLRPLNYLIYCNTKCIKAIHLKSLNKVTQ